MTTITEQVTAQPGKLKPALEEATRVWARKHPGLVANYIAVGPGLADAEALAGLAEGGITVEQLRHLGGRLAIGYRAAEQMFMRTLTIHASDDEYASAVNSSSEDAGDAIEGEEE